MSLVSVLEGPTYAFQYPEGYNVVDALVVRRIGAYDDDNNVPQSLLIGASSNIDIETQESVRMFVNETGSLDLFTSSWDGVVRTDTQILQVSAADNTTLITTSNQTLEVRGGDYQKSTTVSHTEMLRGADGTDQFINLPVGEQFYFGNDVNIDNGLQVSGNAIIHRSMLVDDHLIVYGNIFGSNLNLWRSIDSNIPENNNISQIGFGFRVNSNHQLELVKYSKFNSKTVAKKVAVFGQNKFNENMNSDDGIVYESINDILGQTDLPDMPNAINTVELTNPINTYWAAGANGIYYNGGFVGINNNNPEYNLDVGGEARFLTLNADLAIIRQASTTSDARLKNIVAIKDTADCLEAINNLRVTSYTFKKDGDDGKLFDGLIAQEVEEIIPHAVSQNKFDDLEDCKTIDYSQIIANLIGAVQQLSAIVASKLE